VIKISDLYDNIDHAILINQEAEQRRREVEIARKMNIEEKIKKEANDAKLKEAEEKNKELREKQLEQQIFFGESERGREIRARLLQIGDSINNLSLHNSYIENREEKITNLMEEAKNLKTEYLSVPLDVGIETYRKIELYQSLDGERQLVSTDQGKSWKLRELGASGYHDTGRRVIVENNKPAKYEGYTTNEQISRYFGSAMIKTSIGINLVDKEPEKEATARQHQKLMLSWKCEICDTMNQPDLTHCKRCQIIRKALADKK
jgi:hypothetical protein